MKKIVVLLTAVVSICACTTGRKQVTQGIEYTHPQANKSYYEFTSYDMQESPLLPPSVMAEGQPTGSAEEPLGEDEDFTSENISSSYGTYGDVVITVATHKFKLGANATRKEVLAFQKAMDGAYTKSLQQYRPVGFTYSMSSVGPVNPLSDMEVTCKMSEQSANAVGQATCNNFFRMITSGYAAALKEGN